jgi:hypothetical protein
LSDAGAYASDTIRLDDAWTLTIAARFNAARVMIEDRSGEDVALNGTHRFSRTNPAVGVNFNPTQSLTAYAGYSEGMRAPTPIELTCADPNAPCKLPNQFLADPPLDLETGHGQQTRQFLCACGDFDIVTQPVQTDLHGTPMSTPTSRDMSKGSRSPGIPRGPDGRASAETSEEILRSGTIRPGRDAG